MTKFGDWSVDTDGTLENENGYWIGGWQLNELDWVEHMSEKCWVKMETFIPAFAFARKIKHLSTF